MATRRGRQRPGRRRRGRGARAKLRPSSRRSPRCWPRWRRSSTRSRRRAGRQGGDRARDYRARHDDSGHRDHHDGEKALTVATWNVAAINNNPFEYWIHSEDESYNKLMADVQAFISEPGDKDVRVKEVFTDAMWDELKEKMKGAGWAGVDDVDDLWQDDYRRRKIVSGFLKDAELGSKRLASMPDRVTNTIRSVDGKKMRPTVINCYEQEFSSLQDWWTQWKTFIFETEVRGSRMVSYNRLSAPSTRHHLAEEAVSLPLQTLAGAIFDAILVHMMQDVASDMATPRTQPRGSVGRRTRALDISTRNTPTLI